MALYYKRNGSWKTGQSLYKKQDGAWSVVGEEQIVTAQTLRRKYAWEKCTHAQDENTLLLLNFDDEIADASGNLAITNHNVTIASDIRKFGNGAGYFNGTNAKIALPAGFSLGNYTNFTLDWWEYCTYIPFVSTIYHEGYAAGRGTGTAIGYIMDGLATENVYISSNGSSWDSVYGLVMGTPTLNTWVHRAFVKNGNTFYGFENGVLKDTKTSTAGVGVFSNPTIGFYDYSPGYYYAGYLDEFRISNVARWTSDFTPSDKPYALLDVVGYVESESESAYPDGAYGADGYYYRRV